LSKPKPNAEIIIHTSGDMWIQKLGWLAEGKAREPKSEWPKSFTSQPIVVSELLKEKVQNISNFKIYEANSERNWVEEQIIKFAPTDRPKILAEIKQLITRNFSEVPIELSDSEIQLGAKWRMSENPYDLVDWALDPLRYGFNRCQDIKEGGRKIINVWETHFKRIV